MKNTQNIATLIAQLEYEVGRECYNPNSYDGYTGIEGLGYKRFVISFSQYLC